VAYGKVFVEQAVINPQRRETHLSNI